MIEIKCGTCTHYIGGQNGSCAAPLPEWAQSPRLYREDGHDCPAHSAHDPAPDMLEALRLHQAWIDSEDAGPDYGGQSRDTHPDGEKIWRAWFDGNLDLCERATSATRAAIAKAEGKA